MKLFALFTVLSLLFLTCSQNLPSTVDSESSGSAQINMNFEDGDDPAQNPFDSTDTLTLVLTAEGHVPVRQIIAANKINGRSVTKTFSSLSAQKTWTCDVQVKDEPGTIIYSGTTTFEVKPNETQLIPLQLSCHKIRRKSQEDIKETFIFNTNLSKMTNEWLSQYSIEISRKKLIHFLNKQQFVNNFREARDGSIISIEYRNGLRAVVIFGKPGTFSFPGNGTGTTMSVSVNIGNTHYNRNQEREFVYNKVSSGTDIRVQQRRDESVSLQKLLQIGKYGFVHIATHGGIDPDGSIQFFLSGQDYRSKDSAAMKWYSERRIVPEIISGKWAVMPSFYDVAQCPDFDSSFVILSFCESMKQSVSFYEKFLAKSAASVVGWKGYPEIKYARKAIYTLLSVMIDSGMSADDACVFVNASLAGGRHDDSLDIAGSTPGSAFTLQVTIDPPGSGTVSRSKEAEFYRYGEKVTLVATPIAYYWLYNWSGDANSEQCTITVTINKNMSVTAHFFKPQIWGWGDNQYGQIGDATFAERHIPVPVGNGGGNSFVTDIKEVTGSYLNTYFIKNDGSAWACGANYSGQIGDGTTTDRNIPVKLPGLVNVSRIEHELALKNDGTVWTWGGDSSTPVQVAGPGGIGFLENIIDISAKSNHALVIRNDHTVWAWGANYEGGEIGVNSSAQYFLTPVQVHGPYNQGFLTNIVSVKTGFYHSLALRDDGTVWAWGNNGGGYLGDNTTINRPYPVQVLGPGGVGYLTDVVAISTYGECFAVKSDGTVWAWGPNDHGQLGDNTTIERHAPVQVVGPGGIGFLTDVKAIANGWLHTVVLKNDGTVWAWGHNGYGQIGDNTTTQRSTPVQVLRPDGKGYLTGVKKITSGQDHVVISLND
jgi:alpha-tubulin suppressor-like RCC1 family protein